MAEIVAVEVARQERAAKNDQAKLAQILAANNIQILIEAKAQQIAIDEAREAADMMGGDPSKINSPNLPADFKIPDYVIRAHPSAGGNGLYAFATQFIGTKYSWGGTSLEHGCDCSGFVMGVFKQFGVQLDHSSQAQAQEIGKMTGQGLVKPPPSCNSVTADQIPENAVMTMGPKTASAMWSSLQINVVQMANLSLDQMASLCALCCNPWAAAWAYAKCRWKNCELSTPATCGSHAPGCGFWPVDAKPCDESRCNGKREPQCEY